MDHDLFELIPESMAADCESGLLKISSAVTAAKDEGTVALEPQEILAVSAIAGMTLHFYGERIKTKRRAAAEMN